MPSKPSIYFHAAVFALLGVAYYWISWLNVTSPLLEGHPLPVEFLGDSAKVAGGYLLARFGFSEAMSQKTQAPETPLPVATPQQDAVTSPLNLSSARSKATGQGFD